MGTRLLALLLVALAIPVAVAEARRVASGRYLGKGIRLNVRVPGARTGVEVVQTAVNRKILRGQCVRGGLRTSYSVVPDPQLGLGFFRGKAPRVGHVSAYGYRFAVSEEHVHTTYSGRLKVHMLSGRRGRVAIRLAEVIVLEGRPAKKTRCSAFARFSVER